MQNFVEIDEETIGAVNSSIDAWHKAVQGPSLAEMGLLPEQARRLLGISPVAFDTVWKNGRVRRRAMRILQTRAAKPVGLEFSAQEEVLRQASRIAGALRYSEAIRTLINGRQVGAVIDWLGEQDYAEVMTGAREAKTDVTGLSETEFAPDTPIVTQLETAGLLCLMAWHAELPESLQGLLPKDIVKDCIELEAAPQEGGAVTFSRALQMIAKGQGAET